MKKKVLRSLAADLSREKDALQKTYDALWKRIAADAPELHEQLCAEIKDCDRRMIGQLRDNFFLHTPMWSNMQDLIEEQANLAEQSLRDQLGEDIFGHDWTYDDLPVQKCVH